LRASHQAELRYRSSPFCGFEFLFSLNRLNVATSRSQAVVILVASPRLLEAQCKTPRQMRLVNGFCGAVAAGAKGSR
jgi:hypothetical protein